jgi:hypothetical protein
MISGPLESSLALLFCLVLLSSLGNNRPGARNRAGPCPSVGRWNCPRTANVRRISGQKSGCPCATAHMRPGCTGRCCRPGDQCWRIGQFVDVLNIESLRPWTYAADHAAVQFCIRSSDPVRSREQETAPHRINVSTQTLSRKSAGFITRKNPLCVFVTTHRASRSHVEYNFAAILIMTTVPGGLHDSPFKTGRMDFSSQPELFRKRNEKGVISHVPTSS